MEKFQPETSSGGAEIKHREVEKGGESETEEVLNDPSIRQENQVVKPEDDPCSDTTATEDPNSTPSKPPKTSP